MSLSSWVCYGCHITLERMICDESHSSFREMDYWTGIDVCMGTCRNYRNKASASSSRNMKISYICEGFKNIFGIIHHVIPIYLIKIQLHNNILHKWKPNYIQIFPIYLRMPQIFRFPTVHVGSWLRPTSHWKICEYQNHIRFSGKIPM